MDGLLMDGTDVGRKQMAAKQPINKSQVAIQVYSFISIAAFLSVFFSESKHWKSWKEFTANSTNSWCSVDNWSNSNEYQMNHSE